jgi:transcriptional regulator with XRE-family HTH domain
VKYIFKPERIKTFREAHDMTLEVMAEKMGKPKQLLSVWENGVNSPSLENLLLICNTFQVEPTFFFDWCV